MRILPALVALSVAGSALAQDATDDWDLYRTPRDRTTMASLEFDTGIQVGVRCIEDNLEVMIAGLPNASNRSLFRTLDYAFGDAPLQPSTWWIGERGGRDVIFAHFPAGLARQMRAGGALNIRLPAEGDDLPRRHTTQLPPSPAAINEVLTACGKPLENRRDALRSSVAGSTPAGVRWVQPPRPEYPSRAIRKQLSGGVVVVSCLSTAEGRVEACEIESEFPGNAGFGTEAIRATNRARLAPVEGAEMTAGRVIAFTITFRMA